MIGIDVCAIGRMEKHVTNERFLAKILTQHEQVVYRRFPRAETLAGFFAAKEAVSKAMGTGIGPIAWKDIEIRHKKSGQPYAIVSDRRSGTRIRFAVSISHDAGVAIANAQLVPDSEQKLPPEELRRIPRRRYDANKYTAGTALVIGASPGMTGSIRLAAMAALRAGAGMCFVAVPPSVLSIVESSIWEPVIQPLVQPDPTDLLATAKRAHGIGIGPGMGWGAGADAALGAIFTTSGAPVVADADALRWIANDLQRLKNTRRKLILTPHDGELNALLQEDPTDERAAAFAEEYDIILIRKGPRSTVFGAGKRWKNPSGTAALASPGAGDVLTGTIAALLAQGMSCWDAATVGVYVHGLAAEMAAKGRDSGLVAGDLLHTLPEAVWTVKEEDE